MSLYNELGGESAIDAVVRKFYFKVLGDTHINAFFEDVDMERQQDKQKLFFTMVLGGPNSYTGQDMRAVHKPLVEKMGLNESHFKHVIEHLRSTLIEVGVAEDKVCKVIAIANSVRADVLNQ